MATMDLMKFAPKRKEDEDIILSEEHAKALAEERKRKGLSQGIADMQAAAKPPMPPTTTIPTQSPAPTSPVTPPPSTTKSGFDLSKGYELPSSWASMKGAYDSLGDETKQGVKDSYDRLAIELKNLNDGFGEEMRMAKDKAEKQKTRAEWASIASLLAKNVVGFTAALQGVDPKAMAYETMDWGKRIADINDEMKMNLDEIRARMKDRVEEKKATELGIREGEAAGISAQLKGLDAESRRRQAMQEAGVQQERDVYSAQAQAERDRIRTEEDRKTAEAKTAQERTTTKPEDLRNTLTALGKAKTVKEAAQIAATAGVPQETLNILTKQYDKWYGDDEVGAVAAFSNVVREASAARGGVSTTTTTGQSGQGMVQSPDTKVINGVTYKKVDGKWIKQ